MFIFIHIYMHTPGHFSSNRRQNSARIINTNILWEYLVKSLSASREDTCQSPQWMTQQSKSSFSYQRFRFMTTWLINLFIAQLSITGINVIHFCLTMEVSENLENLVLWKKLQKTKRETKQCRLLWVSLQEVSKKMICRAPPPWGPLPKNSISLKKNSEVSFLIS